MKVLHVEMGRYLYGGARQVAYLLDGLAQYPGEHVLACAQGAEIAGAIRNPAVKVCPLKFKGDLDLGFIPRLRQLIRLEKPDLLHIHSRRGDMLGAWAGWLENRPMIHSRRVDNPPGRFDLRRKFPLFRTIVTISEGIRQVLLQAGVPAEKVRCIPSAVDTELYRPECDKASFLAEFGLRGGSPVLATVAQLIPRKGHTVLFDALPAVLARHPDVQVLIFGQGPLQEELQRSVRERGLDATVRFAGFRSDLPRIMPCFDILVHPAWMEGLGVSLLEAAACGVPIVACRAGGIPEAVRDGVNGYLVEPGDSRGLAEALLKLLDKPDRGRSYGAEGRSLVLQHYSIARMVRDNDRTYREILDLSGGAKPPHPQNRA
ncbi:glycosyltransferase [Methylococcus sp. EFPC2]|uniref:glycosyltransferase n=1 Tax=Methylococcus sp. EFPC2 TaxID=2812648 RepID=UPI0019678471|nr:glycosyltransferase [Methylococcus sp. EFPC2]QSA96243.1 glycosyltransferase [Methylococcus sp. EFPC2]